MAMEIPKAQKVNTTVYENFRGVDFTNDPSNVWYRRSPDAYNMLPDEAGRPFKRTGWKIEVSAQNMAELYADDNNKTAPSEVTIRKCHYFELAGKDHVIIFTNIGVFVYRETEDHVSELLSSKSLNANNVISYDKDMIESYDRAFFFEGGGKSAFYTYGNFKIWEYSYNDDDGFLWQAVDPYVPRVNIGVDARHESGTSYEAVNMLSNYICEEFQDNNYLSVTSSTTTVSGGSVSVDDTLFITMVGTDGTYEFTYTTADHAWLLGGDQVLISNYGITLTGTPADGNKITVVLGKSNRINLTKHFTSISGMKVEVSDGSLTNPSQFNKTLNLSLGEPATPTTNDCALIVPVSGNSYIKFYKAWTPLVEGEDSIRITYPRNAITPTTHRVPADPSEYITINVGA